MGCLRFWCFNVWCLILDCALFGFAGCGWFWLALRVFCDRFGLWFVLVLLVGLSLLAVELACCFVYSCGLGWWLLRFLVVYYDTSSLDLRVVCGLECGGVAVSLWVDLVLVLVWCYG